MKYPGIHSGLRTRLDGRNEASNPERKKSEGQWGMSIAIHYHLGSCSRRASTAFGLL